MKHSIVLASNNLFHLTNCLSHVISSINSKNIELIVVWYGSSDDISAAKSTTEAFIRAHNYRFILENRTLTRAWNAGLEKAKGDYITLLTDTVVVSNGFLAGLLYCIDTFTDMHKAGPVGVVGPVTNYAVKRQQVTLSKKDPRDVEEVQAEIQRQVKNQYKGQPPWLIINELSPVCIMLRKEVLVRVGNFHNEYTNDETCVHDWFIRVANSGYYTIATGDVYVYRTIDKSTKSFYGHQVAIISDDIGRAIPKVAFIYRISINNNYQRDVFVASLTKAFGIADSIYILDANSNTSVVMYLKEKWPDIWKAITKYERTVGAVNVSKDFNQLIDWAKQDGVDWVFTLEGDEVLENKVTRSLLQRLIVPVNPQMLGYNCHIYPIWNEQGDWRSDGLWSKLSETRLFSLKSNWLIPDNDERKSPKLAPECVRDTSIRIKCYGYATKQQRDLKIQTYKRMCIDKNLDHPGFPFYKSLLRGELVNVQPWIENRTISIYTPINKGGQLMDEWFDQLWAFADEIIVGNDGMSDTDLLRAKQWGASVGPISVQDNFSKARNVCLRQCNCSHVFQLDLDERFDDWGQLRRYIDHPYYKGWIFSIDNFRKNEKPFTSDTLRLFENDGKVEYWGLLHESIDDYARTQGWALSKSLVRIQHYGYVLHPNLSGKMQRYLRLNLQQIKEFPDDGRAYYNLAMHFLEDNIKPEALMLLKIASALSPRYGLPAEELSRLRLIEAHHWAVKALQSIGDRRRSPYLDNLEKQLRRLLPVYIPSAKGHAIIYFADHEDDFAWLRKHCIEILRTLPVSLRDY